MNTLSYRGHERRQGSIWKPFAYYFLELTLFFVVLSVFELNGDPLSWSVWSYLVLSVWVVHITKKLFKILERQSNTTKYTPSHR